MPYLAEFDPEKPLPARDALKGALEPFKAFIGGTESEPVDQSANFFEGENVSRIATVINDTRREISAKSRGAPRAPAGKSRGARKR